MKLICIIAYLDCRIVTDLYCIPLAALEQPHSIIVLCRPEYVMFFHQVGSCLTEKGAYPESRDHHAGDLQDRIPSTTRRGPDGTGFHVDFVGFGTIHRIHPSPEHTHGRPHGQGAGGCHACAAASALNNRQPLMVRRSMVSPGGLLTAPCDSPDIEECDAPELHCIPLRPRVRSVATILTKRTRFEYLISAMK